MRTQNTATRTKPRTETRAAAWPELPWEEWRSTADTLHMFSQVLGKLRLALCPPEPHWSHVALYVTATGLTTEPMPYGSRQLQLDLDLIDHRLRIGDSTGRQATFSLVNRAVDAFYADTLSELDHLGMRVALNPKPQEVPDPIPFPDDSTHHAYDPFWARRFHQVLLTLNHVFAIHRAPYQGPHTRVNFFWGSFDLAYTRFSGRPASPPPDAGVISREAMNAEQVCCGFWPGNDASPAPSFFAYAYPSAEGLADARVEPSAARWNQDLGEFVLPYDDVRAAASPQDELLHFLDSTFRVATADGDWPGDNL